MVDFGQWRQVPHCDLLGRMGGGRAVNDAFTMNLKEIARPSPRTSDASRLRRYARSLDAATAKVESRWGELSPEERTAYAELAQTIIEPPESKEGKMRSFVRRSRLAWNLSLIALKGGEEAYIEYRVAFRRFVETVLDAIEYEDPAYQEALAEALEEGLSGETGEPMTVEEARERRRRLRHQVLD